MNDPADRRVPLRGGGGGRWRGTGGAALGLVVLSLLPVASVAAHEFRPAVLTIDPRGEGRFAVALSLPPTSLAGPVAPGDLRLTAGPGCTFEVPGRLVACAQGAAAPALELAGLSAHPMEVVVRWRGPAAPGPETEVLTPTGDTARISLPRSGSSPPPPSLAETLGRFVYIGVEHILFGADHLLFVLGLWLLLTPGMGRVVRALTAFTVAHSLTLALSVLDLVRLSPPPVEAIIAGSVLLVAIECAREARRGQGDAGPGRGTTLTRRHPALLAFVFGLVHGLGFAGALREVGLPEGRLLPALLGFNLGVELGQVAVVGAVAALAAVVVRGWRDDAIRRARLPLAYALGSVSAAWTLDRVLGAWPF